MAKNVGKLFEEDIQNSCEDQSLFFYRIKDVNPLFLKKNARVSKNLYDSFIFKQPFLFAIECKSTEVSKSINFNQKIKQHQIEALEKSAKHKGIIAGFFINYKKYNNETYFIHINDFLKLKHVAENQIKEHTYKSKINKSSISLENCREIGIPLLNRKKQVKYTYYVNKLLDELIVKYGDN
ncbi:Holliday junction resolvase RecU [Niallia taxi]